MTTLFRPVGLHELSLIWDSGMRKFPPRSPHQPIFYPVANAEYAAQIAREWNTKDGSLAGYVTKFEVADSYIAKFESHTVGSALHREYWIPAERLPEFNAALQGTIALQSAFFGPGFQGFVADRCASHVALRQEVTAQAIGDLAGIDPIVFLVDMEETQKQLPLLT